MRSGTLMIGIAGGTGSGKTTLVRKLGERFGSSQLRRNKGQLHLQDRHKGHKHADAGA